jgi:hypothetical protein
MIRAANRFAEAAERLSASLDRFLEFQRYEGLEFGLARGERLPGELVLGLLGDGELPDEEAGTLANDIVHQARKELGREAEVKAPSQEDIVRWWRGEVDPDGFSY